MIHKSDFSVLSSLQIENAIGQQLERLRLSYNMTQKQLADAAGVSRSTITRLAQDGKGISLDSFIRLMQGLQLTAQLEALLPAAVISPLEQLENQRAPRQRARGKVESNTAWTWLDEETS